jgi:aminoglycoside phosphotransferase (APT) family kinase protein
MVARPQSIDPSDTEQVGSALVEFLRSWHSAPDASFSEVPHLLADGTDTFVYAFQLDGPGLSDTWNSPLVARIFKSRDDAAKGERESAVQRFAAARGFRTPAILVFERDGGSLGLPFSIMERAPGVNLLKAFERSPLNIMRFVRVMAEAHSSLHRLQIDGCPIAADGYLVDRRLVALGAWLERFPLDEARAAHEWLSANRTAVIPEERTLCHNDFHPLNLVVDNEDGWMAIDWSRADVGDRLHDVARSYVVMSLAQGGGRNLLERVLLLVSRFVARRYLKLYRRLLPFDERRLRYWEALLTFQSWVETAPMMSKGAEATGARASAVDGYQRNIMTTIAREFWKRVAEFERRR